MIADVSLKNGAFMIYHEGGRRYIPIKFSVRGRDLASAIQDLKQQLADKVKLPSGYNYTWAGEFDSLQKEQPSRLYHPRKPRSNSRPSLHSIPYLERRLHRRRDTPLRGHRRYSRVSSLRSSFSISAAVGFTSLTGVATLGAVVFLSGIRRAQREEGFDRGLEKGCLDEMRPVVMACMAAGLGLLPAARLQRNRRAGPAAAGACSRGWNADYSFFHPFRDAAAREGIYVLARDRRTRSSE